MSENSNELPSEEGGRRHFILGTAGHIDHGKTALVRALTGKDTDRLPEEKKRGITIELGFAELQIGDICLGIVDVPGHERFVRQMLAGATGMDLALLVVAADDSVKPQTREHLEVLKLMDLRGGVLVLTKCDAADEDWIQLVESEVRELVEGTVFEEAPLIRTSALTGVGIDEVQSALQRAVQAVATEDAAPRGPFRMAIDRAFTVPGHGTVVTGSVTSGHVSLGDTLYVEPGGVEVRVRGLHSHDRSASNVGRGQRAAVNLAGIHHDDVRRGQELTTPGHLVPTRQLLLDVAILESAPRPLKHRDPIRLHLGTAEALAHVSLLDQGTLEPGQAGLVQVFLREPVVAVWNQPCVLRWESPLETFGGGRVLVPEGLSSRRPPEWQKRLLQELKSSEPQRRAAAALGLCELRAWEAGDLLRLAGVSDGKALVEALVTAGQLLPLKVTPTRTHFLERRAYAAWAERLKDRLSWLHQQSPLQPAIERSRWLSPFAYLGDRPLLDALVEAMVADGMLKNVNGQIALHDYRPPLTERQLAMLEEIERRFLAGKFQPPAVEDCFDLHPQQPKQIEKLVQLAVSAGKLVHLGQGMFLHHEAVEELRSVVAAALREQDAMTVSEIRACLGTTRKYAVPFCEYLDREGITRRDGDQRRLARDAS